MNSQLSVDLRQKGGCLRIFKTIIYMHLFIYLFVHLIPLFLGQKTWHLNNIFLCKISLGAQLKSWVGPNVIWTKILQHFRYNLGTRGPFVAPTQSVIPPLGMEVNIIILSNLEEVVTLACTSLPASEYCQMYF